MIAGRQQFYSLQTVCREVRLCCLLHEKIESWLLGRCALGVSPCKDDQQTVVALLGGLRDWETWEAGGPFCCEWAKLWTEPASAAAGVGLCGR